MMERPELVAAEMRDFIATSEAIPRDDRGLLDGAVH
jgi:hypothetical protein